MELTMCVKNAIIADLKEHLQLSYLLRLIW